MGYIEETEILLDEEICGRPLKEDKRTKSTIKFRENIKLAHFLCKKTPVPYDPAIDAEDVLQEAYIGLWKACQNFDETSGNRFSTYAVPMIKGQMYRMLRDAGTIREPRSVKAIRTAMNKYNITLPFSDEDINILLAYDKCKISKAAILKFSVMDHVDYLDGPIASSNSGVDLTLSDIVEDTTVLSKLDQLNDDDIEWIVNSILEYVGGSHRDLVEEWLYAIFDEYPITQVQLAKKYDLTQASVSRILRQVSILAQAFEDDIRSLFE